MHLKSSLCVWTKELPCCHIQREEEKELLYVPKRVIVADTKKINKLKKQVKSLQVALVLLKEIQTMCSHKSLS